MVFESDELHKFSKIEIWGKLGELWIEKIYELHKFSLEKWNWILIWIWIIREKEGELRRVCVLVVCVWMLFLYTQMRWWYYMHMYVWVCIYRFISWLVLVYVCVILERWFFTLGPFVFMLFHPWVLFIR